MKRRAVMVGASVLVAGTVLSGCSAVPLSWTSMSKPLTAEDTTADAAPAAASATPTEDPTAPAPTRGTTTVAGGAAPVEPSAPAAAPVVAAPGDLDTGSTTHQLGAGADQLVVDYWTTQDPGGWTAMTQPVIQLSAHLEGSGTAQKSLVTGFSATGVGADGARVELTRDTGSSVITRGFSYGNAFVMPVAADGARRAAVTLQWDLLVETAKGSGQFYRQTVIDTLDLALAAPAAAATPPSSAASSASSSR